MKLSSKIVLVLVSSVVIVWGCNRYNPFTHYEEDFRPQYHFTSPGGWVGSPSGMVYYKGRYHIFYQKNSSGSENGKKQWGHAVSKDLVYWEHLSAALDDEEISYLPGSVVIDWNQTFSIESESEPVMVAIYAARETSGSEQEIRLAYSSDEGRNWTRFEKNPVIEAGDDLVDPSVFWHDETEQWVMVAAVKGEQRVRFYTSDNLAEWDEKEELGVHETTGDQWKSPGLFSLPVDGNTSNEKWVLHMSVEHPDSGGIGTKYVVGEFDGESFQTEDRMENARFTDYGSDFFSPKRFTNIPESDNRQIWMGWMNNSAYAEEVPTEPWKGAISIPRQLELKTIDNEVQLVQQPIVELRELRNNRQRFRNRNLTEETNFLRETGISAKAASLIAEIEPGDAEHVGFELRKGEENSTIVAYDVEEENLYIDRRNSGNSDFSPSFAAVHSAPLKQKDGKIKMRIFLDHSSVVVFGNEGEAVITDQIFPGDKSEGMALFIKGDGARLVSLDVWRLESIW